MGVDVVKETYIKINLQHHELIEIGLLRNPHEKRC